MYSKFTALSVHVLKVLPEINNTHFMKKAGFIYNQLIKICPIHEIITTLVLILKPAYKFGNLKIGV